MAARLALRDTKFGSKTPEAVPPWRDATGPRSEGGQAI